MGASDSKQSVLKTPIEKIGTIESVEDVSCLVVNTANTATTCVDVAAMKAAGAPCLIIGLTQHFLNLMSSNFEGWLRQKYGGRRHAQLTLFAYYDYAHLNISKFATNFQNINSFETGRPASELDLTFLIKAAVIIKHITEYFQRLFALELPDTSPLTLLLRPASNKPTSAAIEKQNAAENTQLCA